MAELMLSPEEQMMSSVGATDVAPTGGFDLTGALQEGYSPSQIADYLASKKGFDVAGARAEGYTDQQILAHLTGNTGFSAGVKRFVESAGSSIKGLAQIAGVADTERLRAERQAAEIASANNPYIGGTAEFAGAIADPINLPAVAVAPLRGATLVGTMARQGAAQGAFGGFLEPVLKEGGDTGFFSADRAKGMAIGTVAGAAIGGTLGKGAEMLVNRMTREAGDFTKTIDDALVAKQASNDAITDVAKAIDPDYNTPAYLRRTGGQGVEASNVSPRASAILDEGQTKLINERITKTEADLARAEEELFNVQRGTAAKETPDLLGLREPKKTETTKQVASLLQPTGKTPQDFGLLPKTPEEKKQVASLLQGATKEEKKQVLETAQTSSSVAYLEKTIADKKAEVERLKGFITRSDEASKQQQTFPVVNKQQTMPAETQAVLERNGFKTMEEANIALGKAPADPLNRAGMAGSVGSMRTDPYLKLAGDVPFETNPEKAFDPAFRGRIDADPVSVDAAINDMHMKAVAATGRTGRELRGRGRMGGSLEATAALGEKQAARMTADEGGVLDWALQNADKSWNREEIAAFMPQYREAQAFLGAQIDEYNRLRSLGQLTKEAEQTIMHRSQVPLGVMSIFQGQRTRASDQLNAFKLAYNSISQGKEVKGFATPGRTCL